MGNNLCSSSEARRIVDLRCLSDSDIQSKHNPRRLDFARDVFEAKASLGNPNISTTKVVVVRREDVLAWDNGFPKFEDCRAQHVVVASLVGGRPGEEDRVLFFSHRWQDADNNQADSPDNVQYAVLKQYLVSPDGQGITHVWVDLSCINQERGTKEGLQEFLMRLDNIGTAICCAAVVLVVPRLHRMEGTTAEGVYYSDLQEYTGRGWCIFESAMARLMGCEIRLGLVCGPVGNARFARLGGSGLAPGKKLSLKALRRGLGTRRRGGRNLSEAALACLPPPPGEGGEGEEEVLRRAARANWEGAFDPGAARADLCRFLREDLEHKYRKQFVQREAATLTMGLDPRSSRPQAAKEVSALLPKEGFTAVRDREVVTKLLVNGGAFVLTGFEAIRPRPERELRALVLEKLEHLDLDHPKGPTLNLAQHLLPCEVGPVLAALTTPGGGGLVGLGGRPLVLRLGGNPIGPHGARCLRDAVAGGGLPPLSRLDLFNCGLGVAGALHLADLLRDPAAPAVAAAAALEELRLVDNGVGDEGARALAEVLPRCPALRTLELRTNGVGLYATLAFAEALPRCPALRELELDCIGVGREAQAAVRAAWAVPLPDGTTREEGGLVL